MNASTYDTTAWWIGTVVMAAGGIVLAAMLFVSCVVLATLAATYSARRFGKRSADIAAMRDWDRAGRPQMTLRIEGNHRSTLGWRATKPVKASERSDEEPAH